MSLVIARSRAALPALALLVISTAPVAAQSGTRLLRTPSVSAQHIAFAYANNVWVVERAGGAARRLTSFQGQTQNPKLSPDGTLIAFSAEYAGNTDVYTVPVGGGQPKRLTWHPTADMVQGWTPDGKAVMFASPRATWAPNAAPRFWTVPAKGGVEAPLPLPRAYQGKISARSASPRLPLRVPRSSVPRRVPRSGTNRFDLAAASPEGLPRPLSDEVPLPLENVFRPLNP